MTTASVPAPPRDPRVHRRGPGHPRGLPHRATVADLAFASALTALNVLLLVGSPVALSGGRTLAAIVALVVVFASLAVRRRAPWLGLVAMLVAAAIVAVADVPLVALGVAPLVSVYSVAARVRLRQAVPALGAALAGLVAVEGLGGFEQDLSTVVGNAVALAAAWGLGAVAASRQRYVAALEERTAELEAAQHALARQAVVDERLRIARELHDIVAHAVSVITVRSAIAAHVNDTRPEEVAPALRAIEEASRQAMDDLRRLVGVLRADGDDVTTAPTPGFADLARLVATVGDPALQVELDLADGLDALDPGLQLTLYRLVQESLTNALRHGSAQHAWVRVHADDGVLDLEVRDDGRGAVAPVADGLGLRGMRERVAMYGGALEAGPTEGRGFTVHARIPVAAATP